MTYRDLFPPTGDSLFDFVSFRVTILFSPTRPHLYIALFLLLQFMSIRDGIFFLALGMRVWKYTFCGILLARCWDQLITFVYIFMVFIVSCESDCASITRV